MKLAIFTTSTNNKYVAYAIVGMLSYQRCYEAAGIPVDVYVVGNFSADKQELIRSSGLLFLQLNFHNIFPVRPKAPYPSECMWWVGVPEALHDLGYSHSLYADPDTFCLKPINTNVWKNVKHIAGQCMNPLSQMLRHSDERRLKRSKQKKLKPITSVISVNVEGSIKIRRTHKTGVRHVNSGVLLFNNEALKKFMLLHKASLLMSLIRSANQYWDGDDSFLAMVALKYPHLHLHHLTRLQYIHNRVGVGGIDARSQFNIVHIDGTRGTRKPWLRSEAKDIHHNLVLRWQSPIKTLPQLHKFFPLHF